MGILMKIKRGYDLFLGGLDRALSYLMLLMLVIITYQVLSRYFSARPSSWPTDISTYCLVAIGFLAMGHLVRTDGHVAVDLVVSHFPTKVRAFLEAILSALATATCAAIVVVSAYVTIDQYSRNVLLTASDFYFPKFILLAFIAAGFTVTTIEFVAKTIGHAISIARGDYSRWMAPDEVDADGPDAPEKLEKEI
ncbi:MAG: TRAP transporter small permease [Clostridiales Family XIII bacterium]|jgi:TRAP-type C4-dicarboxylate transport system permease small subunit|nr:TRAP transporter small permease [Clostridiales Family XIII bacterium]